MLILFTDILNIEYQTITNGIWSFCGDNNGVLWHPKALGQVLNSVNIYTQIDKMADVFELELHDLPEDDPSRAPDSDDDIIDIDEVNFFFLELIFEKYLWTFFILAFFTGRHWTGTLFWWNWVSRNFTCTCYVKLHEYIETERDIRICRLWNLSVPNGNKTAYKFSRP